MGEARFLAILLLADGRRLDYWDIRNLMGARWLESNRQAIRRIVKKLAATGVGGVEVGGYYRGEVLYGTTPGVRMTKLPPDWALEDVLHAARKLRREWSWRMSRHQKSA